MIEGICYVIYLVYVVLLYHISRILSNIDGGQVLLMPYIYIIISQNACSFLHFYLHIFGDVAIGNKQDLTPSFHLFLRRLNHLSTIRVSGLPTDYYIVVSRAIPLNGDETG